MHEEIYMYMYMHMCVRTCTCTVLHMLHLINALWRLLIIFNFEVFYYYYYFASHTNGGAQKLTNTLRLPLLCVCAICALT